LDTFSKRNAENTSKQRKKKPLIFQFFYSFLGQLFLPL